MVPEAVEKTARIKAEQALLQVQKMEALGNLTGGIAHDFNNLLMAVQGSLELLRERLPEDPRLGRLLANAIAGAERGSALTRRMLAFARRQELTTESIDVRQLVEGMAELLRRSLGPTVVLETYFGARVPAIRADANQLETALLNLAVNARDAMDGVGTLVIATDEAWVQQGHDSLAPGRYVRLSVSDSGAGMDEAMLKRAIEPFFTTKGVGKGTGLGLSMVHGLSEQLGGALVLRSRVDEGTTAEIWLPAAPEHSVVAPREVRRDPATARCAPEASISILAVDDDDLVRTTTVDMLEALGYQVIPARSGYEALQVLEATCVDLVITDHAMPQMTGTQLAERIRERWPDLPMIMATGYADLPAGPQLEIPRLAKPYSQASLAEAVERSVSRRD
jgi:nitrogen-specific signal transduction histidine kinase/CheY-like chemotaxis protein